MPIVWRFWFLGWAACWKDDALCSCTFPESVWYALPPVSFHGALPRADRDVCAADEWKLSMQTYDEANLEKNKKKEKKQNVDRATIVCDKVILLPHRASWHSPILPEY